MTDVATPALEAYAEAHTTPPAGHLAEVAEKTRATLGLPQMMVGAIEGRFLEMLVAVSRARSVLEIGTFSGYSALAMAAGLPPDGRITTCEINPTHVAAARANIAASPYADRIEVVEGPALETVERLRGPFDFAFIDADKTSYLAYYEAVLPKLAPSGFIAADNTLWSGRVVEDQDQTDDTRAIREFNDRVVRDTRVVCVQLTVRDGVTLIRRVGDASVSGGGG
jgi:caffeoyl-CoA O-methyltransferase